MGKLDRFGRDILEASRQDFVGPAGNQEVLVNQVRILQYTFVMLPFVSGVRTFQPCGRPRSGQISQ